MKVFNAKYFAEQNVSSFLNEYVHSQISKMRFPPLRSIKMLDKKHFVFSIEIIPSMTNNILTKPLIYDIRTEITNTYPFKRPRYFISNGTLRHPDIIKNEIILCDDEDWRPDLEFTGQLYCILIILIESIVHKHNKKSIY